MVPFSRNRSMHRCCARLFCFFFRFHSLEIIHTKRVIIRKNNSDAENENTCFCGRWIVQWAEHNVHISTSVARFNSRQKITNTNNNRNNNNNNQLNMWIIHYKEAYAVEWVENVCHLQRKPFASSVYLLNEIFVIFHKTIYSLLFSLTSKQIFSEI